MGNNVQRERERLGEHCAETEIVGTLLKNKLWENIPRERLRNTVLRVRLGEQCAERERDCGNTVLTEA